MQHLSPQLSHGLQQVTAGPGKLQAAWECCALQHRALSSDACLAMLQSLAQGWEAWPGALQQADTTLIDHHIRDHHMQAHGRDGCHAQLNLSLPPESCSSLHTGHTQGLQLAAAYLAC